MGYIESWIEDQTEILNLAQKFQDLENCLEEKIANGVDNCFPPKHIEEEVKYNGDMLKEVSVDSHRQCFQERMNFILYIFLFESHV